MRVVVEVWNVKVRLQSRKDSVGLPYLASFTILDAQAGTTALCQVDVVEQTLPAVEAVATGRGK